MHTPKYNFKKEPSWILDPCLEATLKCILCQINPAKAFIHCYNSYLLVYITLQRTIHSIFQRHNYSGRTMALGLTQPLMEMSRFHPVYSPRRPLGRVEV
jgi:hypothetical protein